MSITLHKKKVFYKRFKKTTVHSPLKLDLSEFSFLLLKKVVLLLYKKKNILPVWFILFLDTAYIIKTANIIKKNVCAQENIEQKIIYTQTQYKCVYKYCTFNLINGVGLTTMPMLFPLLKKENAKKEEILPPPI